MSRQSQFFQLASWTETAYGKIFEVVFLQHRNINIFPLLLVEVYVIPDLETFKCACKYRSYGVVQFNQLLLYFHRLSR